jgi:hypothetical protein
MRFAHLQEHGDHTDAAVRTWSSLEGTTASRSVGAVAREVRQRKPSKKDARKHQCEKENAEERPRSANGRCFSVAVSPDDRDWHSAP